MKKTFLLLSGLTAATAQAHTMTSDTGTSISAALSATWREAGAELQDGVWQIPGALMGGEALPVEAGTTLDDANITLQHRSANGSYGLVQIASHNNGSDAEFHHALAGYQLQLHPVQLNLEGGRMAALFSPSNGEHASDRTFSEAPLAYDAFLGRQYNDEGFRVRTAWQGWQLGIESWRGSAFPATSGQDGGSADLYLQHRGHSDRLQWQTGLWWLRADAVNRMDTRYSSGHSHGSTTTITVPELWFDGRSEVSGAFARLTWQIDKDWRWTGTAEWLQLDANGTLRDSTRQVQIDSQANGGWFETGLQFRTQGLALRWEQLALDNTFTGAAADALATLANLQNEHSPQRLALNYRWQLTPAFSLRCEWTRDDTTSNRLQRLAIGIVWQEILWSHR